MGISTSIVSFGVPNCVFKLYVVQLGLLGLLSEKTDTVSLKASTSSSLLPFVMLIT